MNNSETLPATTLLPASSLTNPVIPKASSVANLYALLTYSVVEVDGVQSLAKTVEMNEESFSVTIPAKKA